MLDVGCYPIANLVQLLGPVERVVSLATSASRERTIGSGPRRGERIPVRTPTNVHSLLHFASGSTITLSTSWDVWSHRHGHMELYGSEGIDFSCLIRTFSAARSKSSGKAEKLADWIPLAIPLGKPNHKFESGGVANYRAAGAAEMASAIRKGLPHRCSLGFALHTIDVMTGIIESAESGEFVAMTTSCNRPAPLSEEAAGRLLG